MKVKESYELEEGDTIWVISCKFERYDQIYKAKVINAWYQDAIDEGDYEGMMYRIRVNCTEQCEYRMNENLEYLRCDEYFRDNKDTELFHHYDKGFVDRDEAIKTMKESLKEKAEFEIGLSKAKIRKRKDVLKNLDSSIDKQIEQQESSFSL